MKSIFIILFSIYMGIRITLSIKPNLSKRDSFIIHMFIWILTCKVVSFYI